MPLRRFRFVRYTDYRSVINDLHGYCTRRDDWRRLFEWRRAVCSDAARSLERFDRSINRPLPSASASASAPSDCTQVHTARRWCTRLTRRSATRRFCVRWPPRCSITSSPRRYTAQSSPVQSSFDTCALRVSPAEGAVPSSALMRIMRL